MAVSGRLYCFGAGRDSSRVLISRDKGRPGSKLPAGAPTPASRAPPTWHQNDQVKTAVRRKPLQAGDSLGNIDVFGQAGSFVDFTGDFVVPDTPESYTGQSVFLWYGVQFSGGDFGVLQPVLMFGGDCCAKGGVGPGQDPGYDDAPYWYWSAQYVYPTDHDKNSGSLLNVSSGTGYTCDCPDTPLKAYPGDKLSTRIYYGTDGSWTVGATNVDRDNVYHWHTVFCPYNDCNGDVKWSDLTPYALAVSETYSVSDIDELPSKWQTTNAAFDGHNAGFTTDEVTSQDNEVKCVDNGDSTDICYFWYGHITCQGGCGKCDNCASACDCADLDDCAYAEETCPIGQTWKCEASCEDSSAL